jgi:predicted Zn finger-like uncharacterized protein
MSYLLILKNAKFYLLSVKEYVMLMPKQVEIRLEYECPKCETSFFLDFAEVKVAGFIVVCKYCKAVIKIDTPQTDWEEFLRDHFLKKINLKAGINNSTIPPKSSPSFTQPSPDYIQFIHAASSMLRQNGYTQRELDDILARIQKEELSSITSTGDAIKVILCYVQIP